MNQMAGTEPELAVVVLALYAPDQAVHAVNSLLAQHPPVEIVVVNTGGGGMAEKMSRAGIDVLVAEIESPRFVGAARNIGIARTSAPYVAFLAADCLATPGWAAARLAAHRAGAAAVGTAVVNSDPDNVVAWAAHLCGWVRRLPGQQKRSEQQQHGASYDRILFAKYGLFREGLRTAEDTEFNRRLPEAPVWEPTVMTVHKNPTNFLKLLKDQFARGSRSARAREDLGLPAASYGPRWWLKRVYNVIDLSRSTREYKAHKVMKWSFALIPFALGASCLGHLYWNHVLRHRRATAKSRAEFRTAPK